MALLLGGLPAGAVASQEVGISVEDAEARFAHLVDARTSAEARLVEAEEQLAEVSARLDELSSRSRSLVDQMGAAQQQASRLAVDAYVQGTNDDELRMLDAGTATAVALRMHLTGGRVVQAREAAAELLSLRGEVDADLVALGAEVARLRQGVEDARRDLAENIGAELYAATVLDEARAAAAAEEQARAEREAAARAEAAEAERAAAEAERAAAEARAADEAAQDAVVEDDTPEAPGPSAASSGGGSGSSAGSGTPTPVGSVPVHTEAWEQLRQCESGGNYQSRSNSLYRGAYQFGYSTWESVGGTGDPADAPPEEQDARAYALYLLRGASPWPECGRYLR